MRRAGKGRWRTKHGASRQCRAFPAPGVIPPPRRSAALGLASFRGQWGQGVALDDAHRLAQHLDTSPVARGMLRKMAAEGAAPRLPVVETQDVARHVVET